MAGVDLRGILFRTFFPDLEDDEEYNPVGPDDYVSGGDGIHLSGIKVRTYEEDQESEE